MTKVMISMPMEGKTKDQIKKEYEGYKSMFEDWNERNKDREPFEIVDTLCFDEPSEVYKTLNLYYLAKAIDKMGKSIDLVFFAPGYVTARGCSIEMQVAKLYNIQTLTWDEINHPASGFKISMVYNMWDELYPRIY